MSKEQPVLVEGIPASGRGVELDDPIQPNLPRFLCPAHGQLFFANLEAKVLLDAADILYFNTVCL